MKHPTLWQVWSRTVRAAPEAPALIDAASGRTWTRAELDQEAAGWADVHGAGCAGRTIAFGEPNGLAWLRVFLGLLKADAVVLPLDPGEPIAAQRSSATAAGATALWLNAGLETLRPNRRRARDGRRLIKLTSGSTGTPRALRFTDAQMLADGHAVTTAMGITAADRNLGIIPWGHSYGLGNLVLPLLSQGTLLIAGAVPLPHAIAETVARWQPTVFPAVPALLHALAESSVDAAQLQSLRTVISAGAPLSADVARAFFEKFQRKVHSFYGSSETGGIAFDATGDAVAQTRGIGRPMPGVTISFGLGRRFDVSGPAVFTIGNRRPGTHRMPDLARATEDGELVLLGRAGRFIKIAGRRLNLAEVEHALRQTPGVRDAFVMPHAQRADALAAAVCGDQVDTAAVRLALRERLASWKLPKKLLTLDAFPLTARGKTDTRELRALLSQ